MNVIFITSAIIICWTMAVNVTFETHDHPSLRNKRMTDNTEINVEKYPYIVCVSASKTVMDFPEITYFGGVLVHERFAVVLGSMLDDVLPEDIRIYLHACPTNYDVEGKIEHKGYNKALNISTPIATLDLTKTEERMRKHEAAVILMNATFGNVTSYASVLQSAENLETLIDCKFIGFSPFGGNNTDSQKLTIKARLNNQKLFIRKGKGCNTLIYDWTEFVCAFPHDNHTVLCELGDYGSPLFCPLNENNDPLANHTGSNESAPMALFGFHVLDDLTKKRCTEQTYDRENTVYYIVTLFRYGAWINETIDYILSTFEKYKSTNRINASNVTNVTNATLSNSTVSDNLTTTVSSLSTSLATKTTRITTTKLPEYYDLQDYELLRKKPSQCRSNQYLSFFVQKKLEFATVNVNGCLCSTMSCWRFSAAIVLIQLTRTTLTL